MKRPELEDLIVKACGESGLSAGDQFSAIARARSRLQKQFAPSPVAQPKKSYKPLTRPGGDVMGKKRRESKSE